MHIEVGSLYIQCLIWFVTFDKFPNSCEFDYHILIHINKLIHNKLKTVLPGVVSRAIATHLYRKNPPKLISETHPGL